MFYILLVICGDNLYNVDANRILKIFQIIKGGKHYEYI